MAKKVTKKSVTKRPSTKKAAAKAPKAAKPAKPAKPKAPKALKAASKSAPKAAPKPAPQAAPEVAPAPVTPAAPTPPAVKTPVEEARAFAIEAARLMSDDKCVDIVIIDVTKLTSVSDFIVIGTGTSDRQMRSTLGDITEFGRSCGHQVSSRSEDDRATWVLADFVDVVVHLFEPNTRAYYDLEMMWGDAPRVDWARAAGDKPKVRNRRIVE